jgi:outer membrane scaffolding protein for murein synthesis (MipA/OmpV family)
MRRLSVAVCVLALALASPAAAQVAGPPTIAEPSVFDGTYLTVGVGAAYGPSYEGSDDYKVFPLPLVQGRLGGVQINPRAGGISLDFVPGTLNFGIAGRARFNRTGGIKDPVVESLGELDTAIEVGPSAGVSLSGLLNPYDSLTFGADVLWDVAGAHGGMVVDPSISYFTPLSRGIAASLSVGGEYGDHDFIDYYYRVTPAQSLASGLAPFDPDAGVTKAGVNLLLGFDLNGNLADGGLAAFAIGSYSRLMGDAADSPIVSVRGDPNQFLIAAGLGYTF